MSMVWLLKSLACLMLNLSVKFDSMLQVGRSQTEQARFCRVPNVLFAALSLIVTKQKVTIVKIPRHSTRETKKIRPSHDYLLFATTGRHVRKSSASLGKWTRQSWLGPWSELMWFGLTADLSHNSHCVIAQLQSRQHWWWKRKIHLALSNTSSTSSLRSIQFNSM